MQKQTTTPIRQKQRVPYALAGVAAAGVIGTLGLVGLSTEHDKPEPWGTVNATDGDPAVAYPVNREPEYTLALDFPHLTDIQQTYKRMAEVLPRLPIAYGIDKQPVGFSDTEAAVFTALIYTESSFNPYGEDGMHKVSSAGCTGIAQLCGDLVSFEALNSDAMNLYIGAAEFKRLIDAYGIEEGLRRYKGVATDDMAYQADRVWEFVRVRAQ